MQDKTTSVQTDNTLDINNKKRKGKGKKDLQKLSSYVVKMYGGWRPLRHVPIITVYRRNALQD